MTTFETAHDAPSVPQLPLHEDSFYVSDGADEGLAQLRRAAPVHRHVYDDRSMWVVTRHADAGFVANRPDLFSSSVPLIPSPITDPMNELLRGSLVVSDPPDHRAIRQAVNPFFTRRKALARMEAMENYLADAFDQIVPGEPFNLVDRISAPFPIFVMGQILGIPEEDRDTFVEITASALEFSDPALAMSEAGLEAMMTSMGFFSGLLERRQEDPQDDVATAMLGMDNFTALKSLFQLLLGGLDTTSVLIAQGMLALLRHPGDLARLRSDAELLPVAVEELLRWTTPINYMCREALRDIEIGDTTVEKGDVVVTVLRAANRDAEAFGPTADRLVIDRSPNPHLAFGLGEHFCIGAHLAREETKLFFQRFFERFSSIELAGEPVRRTHFGQTNTLLDLPIIVRP
jgi:cytochrome P450